MDDENKVIDPAEAEKEELEGLRDLFQKKYDETANGPVIQELDEIEEEQPEEVVDETVPAKKEKKAKKKHTVNPKVRKVIRAIHYIVFVAVIFVMGIYLSYDWSFPGHHDYENAITKAEKYVAVIGTESDETGSASAYSNARTAYEEAITICKEGSGLWAQSAKVDTVCTEAKLILANENYQVAYNYLVSALTSDELSSISDKEIKSIIKSASALSASASDVFTVIAEAVNAGDADADVIASSYGLEDEVHDTFRSAVESLINGYKKDKETTSIVDKESIFTDYYSPAITNLVNVGADQDTLAQNMSAVLYENGCTYSAIYISGNVVSADVETKTEKYSAMLSDLEKAAEAAGSIYEKAAEAGGKTGAELYADADITDSQKEILATVADLFIAAIKAENDRNLTLAAGNYEAATSIEALLGVTDAQAFFNYTNVLFNAGSIPAAESFAGEKITEEVEADLTADQQSRLADMKLAFAALDASSEIFSSHYTNYYYYGTAIDYSAVAAELDATITADSNNYDRAFVYYCKYYAALYSGDESVDVNALLAGMKECAPELKALYGYFYLEQYVNAADWANATATADDILSVNIADDYALSVKALVQRMNKNYDAALEIAQGAIETVGTSATYSTKEAGIICLLKGDYDSAYKYLVSAYNANLSLETCDLLLILNHLYEGDNEEVQAGLQDVCDEIDETYTSYSVSSFDSTKAIIDGTKTVEDVLTSGSGTLS